MSKIAIVVQRCHSSLVGGSESLAWHYANLLKDEYDIDIITTAALDITAWANDLPSGMEIDLSGITIYRFPVSIGRSHYWHQLNRKLLKIHEIKSQQPEFRIDKSFIDNWTVAFQEEYIRHQGPYSHELLKFLEEKEYLYELIIFVTYLYPTTYFGIERVTKEKIVLVPTLHNEPAAYLNIYHHMANNVRKILWLTEAEKEFGESLWGKVDGSVIGMGIDTNIYSPMEQKNPYFLYSGRIDLKKGCEHLFDFFIKFRTENNLNFELILIGKKYMDIPNHSNIIYKGFVSDEEKFMLMAGASVFIMPSPYESFSIVTLEAMAQKTPVLVNGECTVLADHVNKSEGGRVYTDYESFQQGIQEIIASFSANGSKECFRAREYVLKNYSSKTIQTNLLTALK